MKRSPLKKTNPKRKIAAMAKAWGPPGYREHVAAQGCSVRGCRSDKVEAHHQPTRGAGGTWRDLLPLCLTHHALVHSLGVTTFTERTGLDMDAVKVEVLALWKTRL